MTSRGIRNNNPGNIRKTRDAWEGLSVGNDLEFFTFKSAKYGIRALAKVLLTYRNHYGLETIEEIISRWAPPSENDTESYINSVAARLGELPNGFIDLTKSGQMELLLRAIITHENGVQPYDDKTILAGMKLALA
tara:strand:- start:386 stop:790 length:405 start_codon:yes stop_codon:yes gene_type:complete